MDLNGVVFFFVFFDSIFLLLLLLLRLPLLIFVWFICSAVCVLCGDGFIKSGMKLSVFLRVSWFMNGPASLASRVMTSTHRIMTAWIQVAHQAQSDSCFDHRSTEWHHVRIHYDRLSADTTRWIMDDNAIRFCGGSISGNSAAVRWISIDSLRFGFSFSWLGLFFEIQIGLGEPKTTEKSMNINASCGLMVENQV